MKYGCVLLAGGKGSRMGGVNKAELEYGGRTFAQKVISVMESTGMPCYISTANYEQAVPDGWTPVKDEVTDSASQYIGPIGGIYSCLKKAKKDGLDGLFFAPCDAPFYNTDILDKLSDVINGEYDVVCWRTSDGKVQTAFGWYSVRLIPALKEDINHGRYKVLKIVENSAHRIAEAKDSRVDEKGFANINTDEDYLRIRHQTP